MEGWSRHGFLGFPPDREEGAEAEAELRQAGGARDALHA
jgi:hypothetical protein